MKLATIVVAAFCLIGREMARAGAPIQLALVAPDLQIIPENEDISGLRLQVYGRNANVNGVDLGFIHETTGNFNGVGFGLVDLVNGNMHGLQWSGFYSQTEKDVIGWPSAIVTRTGGNMKGLQTGIVNSAGSVNGVQLGIVNFAGDMNGLQIGLWNQIDSKENWKVIPIVNWKF